MFYETDKGDWVEADSIEEARETVRKYCPGHVLLVDASKPEQEPQEPEKSV